MDGVLGVPHPHGSCSNSIQGRHHGGMWGGSTHPMVHTLTVFRGITMGGCEGVGPLDNFLEKWIKMK